LQSLNVRDVTKNFGSNAVLRGASLTLEKGSFTVLLGDNGSGKSTLLRIVAGLSAPSSGKVAYGVALGRPDQVRRHIGFLGHDGMLYGELTGRENLRLFGALYGLKRVDVKLQELSIRFNLDRCLDQFAHTYSRGQVQRLALARMLLHAPSLIVLDEPLSGLDAASRDAVITTLNQEQQRGCIILMSTHDLEPTSSLRPRKIRLRQGKVFEE